MKIHELEPQIGLTGALQPDDLDRFWQQGYRALVCNRLPDESQDHDEKALAERAQALGIEWRCIPVASGQYSETDIEAFERALEELPEPLLVFCRSGRRAAHLWALVRLKQKRIGLEAAFHRLSSVDQDPETLRSVIAERSVR